jgi:hypothetical protein
LSLDDLKRISDILEIANSFQGVYMDDDEFFYPDFPCANCGMPGVTTETICIRCGIYGVIPGERK